MTINGLGRVLLGRAFLVGPLCSANLNTKIFPIASPFLFVCFSSVICSEINLALHQVFFSCASFSFLTTINVECGTHTISRFLLLLQFLRYFSILICVLFYHHFFTPFDSIFSSHFFGSWLHH